MCGFRYVFVEKTSWQLTFHSTFAPDKILSVKAMGCSISPCISQSRLRHYGCKSTYKSSAWFEACITKVNVVFPINFQSVEMNRIGRYISLCILLCGQVLASFFNLAAYRAHIRLESVQNKIGRDISLCILLSRQLLLLQSCRTYVQLKRAGYH